MSDAFMEEQTAGTEQINRLEAEQAEQISQAKQISRPEAEQSSRTGTKKTGVIVQRRVPNRKKNVEVLKKEPAESRTAENSKIRVAAYCRVSTDKEEQKSSLKTQMDSFRKLIEEHPAWELTEIYTDEGISGTQVLHREAFNRMIEDCRNGKIDRILTKSISRFARNTVECLSYVRELKGYGVSVYFEKEKLDTESEVSEMALSILAAVAQEESRNLSENMKWGIRKRYEEGKVRWTPTYGYKKENGEDFIVDPETAPVVKRIFDEYLHGSSLNQIVEGLEEDGIPGACGGHWYATRIRQILSNEKYVGDAQCQKTYIVDHITHKKVKNDQTVIPSYYIKDHHEPIVDRKTFDTVKEILSMKDHHTGATQYPYKGLITCPICGEKLERNVLLRKDAPAVWHCRPERGNTKCAGYYIEEKFIDDAIKRAYLALDMEDLKRQAKKRNPEIAESAREAIRMKEEMPEIESVEYYFLDTMIREIRIRIRKWDSAVIIWKCGLKSTVDLRYDNEYNTPFSKKQKGTKPVETWMEIAETAAEERGYKEHENNREESA